VGAKFFTPIQTGHGAHTTASKMGTRSLPQGVQQPGHGIDHSPPSIAKVKGSVELYLYAPFGPSQPVLG